MTVFLHVGMHKTATTYIQNRLRKNRQLLRRHQLVYPPLRRDHLNLVGAVERLDESAWLHWLGEARQNGCHLLISAEALSLVLAQPMASGGGMSRGDWLCGFLRQNGWEVKVIAFVRDQPNYLNSRYTQLTKKMHTISSFPNYVKRVFKNAFESECNLMTLFDWSLSNPRPGLSFVAIPFGGAISRVNPAAELDSLDPFQQLLDQLPLPRGLSFEPVSAAALNQQPGQNGVRLARRFGRYLKRHHPEMLARNACRMRVRFQIERWAAQKGWQKHPFNGLTLALWREIRERYAASNAEFARRAWGDGGSWTTIFGEQPPEMLSSAGDDAVGAGSAKALKPLMKQLLRDLSQTDSR